MTEKITKQNNIFSQVLDITADEQLLQGLEIRLRIGNLWCKFSSHYNLLFFTVYCKETLIIDLQCIYFLTTKDTASSQQSSDEEEKENKSTEYQVKADTQQSGRN